MIATSSAEELVAELAICPPDDPGRPALRERAIRAWIPLAHHLARRYHGRGEIADDLAQVAVAGLIESVDRFEAGRGAAFASYAIPTVMGEIKRHFRDKCWSIRVPRHQQELWLAILAVNDTLTQQLGRTPRVPDIASRLRLTEEDVRKGMQSAQAYRSISLSTPAVQRRDGELGETLGDCDLGYERTELRMALRDAMADLDDRERLILRLRFFDNLTQKQIGARLGVSQMHVSRLLAVTLRRLRHFILEAE
jgi:RNA polymerase sigma-B factor